MTTCPLPAPTQPSDTAFYLQHCVRACEGGVERSHILPFATDGALLLEVEGRVERVLSGEVSLRPA